MGYIFADYVEFEVHGRAYADVAEIGVVERVGDYGYTEAVGFGIAYSEAYTVYGHRAFLHGEVAFAE